MIKIIKRMSSGYIEESFEDRSMLSKGKPAKSLTKKLHLKSGRDNLGTISVRHRGGARRKYRQISTLDQIEGAVKVISIEYDPNRSARIALVELISGVKKYIIAPDQMRAGDQIQLTDSNELKRGDRALIANIPVGSQIYDIQIYPMSRSHIAKSAGTSATLLAIEEKYALLKLPSGELRRFHINCYASLGQVSNPDHSNIRIGKAGRKRLMGIRPTVRGKAMSPNSHPHGGGEGVNPIGLKYPKTPWGKVAIGKKTRSKKVSDSLIVKRRKKR